MKPRLILLTAISAIAALLLSPAITPRYIVNLSHSVPVGLYRLERRSLQRGDLAIIQLGEPWRDLARSRGYLLSKGWLIKPVGALAGDLVCRSDTVITINGHISAVARSADQDGRPLPEWDGCKTLAQNEMFLLSGVDDSFDGLYFGITPRSALIARLVPTSFPTTDDFCARLPKAGRAPG